MDEKEFVVMTDEQIEQGLSVCSSRRFCNGNLLSCRECPYKGERDCIERLIGNALAYISRLKEQRLK